MPQDHLARIEQALQEIRQCLASAPASPRTREHRARLGTFERALMNFNGREPTREQWSALLDGVLELHSRVFGPGRPQVGRPMSTASTPAMRAVLTNPRMSLPQARPSQRPTKPPVGSRPPAARSIPPLSSLPPPPSRK